VTRQKKNNENRDKSDGAYYRENWIQDHPEYEYVSFKKFKIKSLMSRLVSVAENLHIMVQWFFFCFNNVNFKVCESEKKKWSKKSVDSRRTPSSLVACSTTIFLGFIVFRLMWKIVSSKVRQVQDAPSQRIFFFDHQK